MSRCQSMQERGRASFGSTLKDNSRKRPLIFMFRQQRRNRWKSHRFRSSPAGPSGFSHGTKQSGRILTGERGNTQETGRYHGLGEGRTGTPSGEMPMEISSSTSRVPLQCFLFRRSRIFKMSDYLNNKEKRFYYMM